MNILLQLSEPWWHFALRGAVVYLILLCMLRLAGKRSFGEMSAFDVVVLILVGGAPPCWCCRSGRASIGRCVCRATQAWAVRRVCMSTVDASIAFSSRRG